MNSTKKNSAAKPNQINFNVLGQKEHLQTLPCESFEHPHEDQFNRHTGSVCLDLHNMKDDVKFPTSPTFPNDVASMYSQRFGLDKENRPSLINRDYDNRTTGIKESRERSLSPNNNPTLHESRLLRGANQKLTERNSQLQSEIKHLKMMLKESERQLQKKLKEEFGYLDFFKAKNSSQRDAVDIFLELQALRGLNEDQAKQYESAVSLMHSRIQELESGQRQKEEKFTQEVKLFSETIDKLNNRNQKLKDQVKLLQARVAQHEELERKYRQLEGSTVLFKESQQEIDRQRQQLTKRIKQLEDQSKAKQVRLNQAQSNYADIEKEYETVSLENQKHKQIIRKMEKKFQGTNKEKERLARLLEEERETANNLKAQVENLEEHKLKTNKEMLKISNDLKTLRHENEFQKQAQTERQLVQLDNLRSEIDQLKLRLERERLERQRLQSRCSHSDQEYIKLQSQLNEIIRESNKQIELTRNESQKTKAEVERQLSDARHMLNDLKKKCAQLQTEGRNREYGNFSRFSSKGKQDYFANESRIQTLEKYQSGHHKNETRLSSKLKEILRVLRESLPKYDSIRAKKTNGLCSPSGSCEEQLESYANEISMLVNNLILLEQKESKQNELLHERMDAYEKERDSFQQDKSFEIGLKEEAIKKLIQFVPGEYLSTISEYLFVVEEMAARCTNQHLQEKTEMLNQISQNAYSWRQRYKQLEQVDRKFCELKAQHEQLRRMFTVNQSKRGELSEINKRDVKKKYFDNL